jgi:hypothetical protein
MVGCTPSLPATNVFPSRICRDHNFRDFARVGLLDSNVAWVTLFHEKHTNPDVTISSHHGGGLPTVILSSTPPPPSTPIRCLNLFSALQLATPPPPSTLPRWRRRYRCCLQPLLLLLNAMQLPPSRPGRRRLIPAVPPAVLVLPQMSTYGRLLPPIWLRQSPSSTTRIQMSLRSRGTSHHLAPTHRSHASSPCQ